MRTDFVNADLRRVKVSSWPDRKPAGERRLASFGRHQGGPTWREHGLMADLAFAVLLIAGFLILAVVLRGLEKL